MLLQFFYLMIGLETESKVEDLSTRLMSGYSCSAFKVVGLMGDGVKAGRRASHTLGSLIKFVEIYFWKDFTFLSIDHQLDPKDVISAIHNFHCKHEKSIVAYSEVLLFDEDKYPSNAKWENNRMSPHTFLVSRNARFGLRKHGAEQNGGVD
jgi:hypothetical protein